MPVLTKKDNAMTKATMFYVYSTLSANQNYDGVHIAGGTGVANSRTLVTPRGMVTPVTEEQLAILKNNRVFNIHQKAGYIDVQNKEVKPEKVAKNMADKDKGAQETKETLDKKTQDSVKDKDSKVKVA